MSKEQSWACWGEDEEGSVPAQLCGWCCCAVPRWEFGLFPSPRWGSHCYCYQMLEQGYPKPWCACPNQSPPSPTWQGHWWGLQTLAKNSGKLLLSTAASAGSTCRQVEAGTWLLHTEVGWIQSPPLILPCRARLHSSWETPVVNLGCYEKRQEGRMRQNTRKFLLVPPGRKTVPVSGPCPEQTYGGLREITRASPEKMRETEKNQLSTIVGTVHRKEEL